MSEVERDLQLLEALERDPEVTQAGLAAQLGVAVGSVNWYLKRLIRKGYVKVTHLQRRRMKYFVTPEGLALKARLTMQYMKASLRVYRELREAAQEVLSQVRQAGHSAVWTLGHDEAIEIFRLTCLEEDIEVFNEPSPALPEVQVEGTRFTVIFPQGA
ncbi:MAG: winged helix-turn-helix transcriptional regulator [Anaerolineae bacterium]|nr:winged helix-turn-helix transcriptional regulator [Anaerolineae bacterium]